MSIKYEYSSTKPYNAGSGAENDKIANMIVQETCKIFYPLWIAVPDKENSLNDAVKYQIDMYLYATPEDRKNKTNPLCGLELDRATSETWIKGEGYYDKERDFMARKVKLMYKTPMRIYHLQLNDRIDEYGRDGVILPYAVMIQNKVVMKIFTNNDNKREGVYRVPREQLVYGLERFEDYILTDVLDIYNTACSAVGGIQLTKTELINNRNLMRKVFGAVNKINNSVNRRDHLTGKVNHCPKEVFEDETYVIDKSTIDRIKF